MIRGTVNGNLEAILPIKLHGAIDATVNLYAAVDTGFDGFLILDEKTVELLDLPIMSTRRVVLGDSSTAVMKSVRVDVEFAGRESSVIALVSKEDSMIGMRLMLGWNLRIHVREGGTVELSTD